MCIACTYSVAFKKPRLIVGFEMPRVVFNSIMLLLFRVPFLVVINTTPLAALAPYIAAAAASFNISTDSISLGLRSIKGLVGSLFISDWLAVVRGTPSTTYKGWLLAEIEEVPLILTLMPSPTLPLLFS